MTTTPFNPALAQPARLVLAAACLTVLAACSSLSLPAPDLSPAKLTMALAPAAETLPSGVTVTHTQVGSGASPTATDKVKVHYRGTLVDGTEFDSSYKRSAPASFALNRVIPCWTQGLQRMKVGGKARLTCPAATAYGEKGAGGVIPPNAALAFDVELLAIEN